MVKKQEIIISYYRDGDSERKIARRLKISRTTVRRYLEEYKQAREAICSLEKPDGQLIDELVKPPRYISENRDKRKLTPEITGEIDALLKLNKEKKSQGLHKQVLKKIDILDHLHDKGYDIGYTSVCEYISKKNNKKKEAYIRQVYDPGDICEFDWGEVKLFIDGKLVKLNMAVFTSAYSNFRYAILFYRQDTISFQQAHVYFFEYSKGVYKTLLYDNMRVAIAKLAGNKEKEPTEALLKLSMYYHFGFRFCNIGKGNEKGHVERSVEYIRRKAFSLKDTFDTLDQANSWLLAICNKENTRYGRSTKGKKPLDLFNQEKSYLYSLPPRFDCASIEQCKVDKYSTISYQNNHYSLPDHLVGEEVDVKVYPEKLIGYYQNNKVCEHERKYEPGGWYIKLDHYLGTLYYKPGALAGSQALKLAPGNVKEIYKNYFDKSSKEFIELLLFARDNKYDFLDIAKVINRIKEISPNDISLEKIKALCMEKESPDHNREDRDDQILKYSTKQLNEYGNLLN